MLKRESLMKMAKVRGEWCVSIFLPLGQADSQKNRTRLKTLMFEAERKLIEIGTALWTVAKMLAPIESFLDTDQLQKNKKVSLALFLTPDSFVFTFLPIQLREAAIVSNRFYLKPLPAINADKIKMKIERLINFQPGFRKNLKNFSQPKKILTTDAGI